MRKFIQAIAIILILAAQGLCSKALAQEEWTLSPDEIAILEAQILSSDERSESPFLSLYMGNCNSVGACGLGGTATERAAQRFNAESSAPMPPVSFAEDGFAPTIVSLSASPNPLDMDSGQRTITVSYDFSDAGGSGLDRAIIFLSKSGTNNITTSTDLSGDSATGTVQLTLPAQAPAGEYNLQALIYDNAGNQGGGVGGTLQVINSAADELEPVIVSMSASPNPLNMDSGQRTVSIAYNFSDDGGSGLDRAIIYLSKTGTNNIVTSTDLTGNSASGTVQLSLPDQASAGEYNIQAIIYDNAGNTGGGIGGTLEVINSAADEIDPTIVSMVASPNPLDIETGRAVTINYNFADEGGSGLDRAIIYLSKSGTSNITTSVNLSGNSASGSVEITLLETAPTGTYNVQALIYDNAGNTGGGVGDTLTVRNGRPQFNVTSTSSGTITGSFDVRVESSRPVTGFDQSDISLVNIASSAWNCTSSTSQPAVCTGSLAPANDGEVRVFVPEGVAQDVAGATNEASNILTLQYDGSHPTVALSSTATEPVSGAFPLTVTFSEDVTGFELSDLTVGNGVASNLSGSGAVYTATITPSGDGAVTVDVAADVATDAAGNGNTAATQFSLTNDGTAPGVSIATSVNEPASGSFPITVTFTEDVTGFELSDLTVGNGTASELAGSGAIYTATITPAGDGAVTVDIAADVAEDAAGNGNTAATQLSIESDGSAPGVTLATTASEPVSGAFEVSLTFTETVTGLELSDLSVTNGTASNLAGSGASYTVSITPSSDGDVSVSLPAGSAQDEAGNDNTVSNTLSIEADLTAPSVALSSTATEPVSGAFPLTVTFSEDVTGFELSDLTVGNGVASGLSGSGAVYTATITPSGDGAVTVDVASDVATDAAGNGNTAATQFSIENDIDPPEVQMTSNAATVTGPFNVEIIFNKPIEGFEQSDLVVFNGTVTGFVATSDRSFELEITPDTVGTVTVRIPSGAAVDALGQGNAETELSVEAIIPTSEVSITVSQSTTDVTGVLGTAQISNPGGQSLPFEASTNVDWLAVEPSSGQIPALESLEFTFRLTEAAESLEPGTYNAVVTIRRLGANALAASSIATAAGAANPTLAEVPIVLQVEARTGTLRLIARTPSGVSGDAEFTYSSSNSLVDGLVLSTSGGSANSADLELTFGQYSIAQASPVGWRVESISCSGDTDNGSVVDVEAASLIADVDAGESLVCTFVNVRDEDLVRAATQRVINNFLVRRSENILNAMPDLSRRFDVRSHGLVDSFRRMRSKVLKMHRCP